MALQWLANRFYLFPHLQWRTWQSCALRVVSGDAGRLCEATEFGYLIHEVDASIGQHAALRPGAVIIEIDGQSLQGLDAVRLEIVFASSYANGVHVSTLDSSEINSVMCAHAEREEESD